MLIILEYLCIYETKQRLTFVLLSPDSPQLSLGETDEENSTKPHVRPTLLPPSPTLFTLFFFCFPCCPSHYAGRTGRLTPPLPRLDVAPFFASLLSHTTACFFLTSAKVCLLFLPPLSVSLSRPQCNFWDDRSMAGKELTNSWSAADWGVCALPSLQILYFLPLRFNHSLPPLSFFCLSLTFSLILSLTELWIFIRLPQRGNIYVLLHFFLSFQALKKKEKRRGLELGGACLPHVEACWTKTNVMFLNGWHLEKCFPFCLKSYFMDEYSLFFLSFYNWRQFY